MGRRWHRRLVGLYTRQQIALLLALLAAGGIGLAIRHWRAAHPNVAAQIEGFDLRGDDEADRALTRAGSRSPKPVPSLADTPPLDLNHASADDLARLPGVGPALAARIVAARPAAGFGSIDDLVRVKGLGRTRIERLRPLVRVADEAPDAKSASTEDQ